MLTKNGKNLILSGLIQKKIDYKLTDGSVITFSYSNPKNIFEPGKMIVNSGTKYQYCGMCVLGSGTTKESDSDFKLEQQVDVLTNNSLSLTQVITNNEEFGDEEFRYVAIFTNNTQNKVTVTEIGLIFIYSDPNNILFYRKTFDPVTFEVGETKTFTIVLS